jgi:hypothetical protein
MVEEVVLVVGNERKKRSSWNAVAALMYNRCLELELSLEPCPWSLARPQAEALVRWRASSGRASIQSCEANETAAISAGLSGPERLTVCLSCSSHANVSKGVIARVIGFDSLQRARYGARVRNNWVSIAYNKLIAHLNSAARCFTQTRCGGILKRDVQEQE